MNDGSGMSFGIEMLFRVNKGLNSLIKSRRDVGVYAFCPREKNRFDVSDEWVCIGDPIRNTAEFDEEIE